MKWNRKGKEYDINSLLYLIDLTSVGVIINKIIEY